MIAREILDKYGITVVSECDINLDIELDEFWGRCCL